MPSSRHSRELVDLFAGATRPVLFTGAGFSVASGLPTYRGDGGLWTEHPEREKRSTPPPAKMNDPELRRAWWNDLWEMWGPLREIVTASGPNVAHVAAARWADRVESMTVITQNVDGLHTMAGSPTVVELHGTLFKSRCSKSRCSQPVWDDAVPCAAAPNCPKCGRPARPDVVLFGENLDPRSYAIAEHATSRADLFVVCGTSGSVWPANQLPRMADYDGVPTVYIGPDPWEGPAVNWTHQVTGTAEADLVDLLAATS